MKMMKNVFFFRASRYEAAADTMNGKCSNTMGEREKERRREKFQRLIAARFITQERNDTEAS